MPTSKSRPVPLPEGPARVMAHQLQVLLLDDLDGSQAERTVTFSLDGQQYEIDLSIHNIRRLYEVLAPYTAKARKVRHPAASGRRAGYGAGDARLLRRQVQAEAVESSGAPADHEPSARENAAEPTSVPATPTPLFSNPTGDVARQAHVSSKPPTAGIFNYGS